MKRKSFDMNQCKHQDLLVTRGGAKIMYINKIDSVDTEEYPFVHRVAYLVDDDGYITAIGTRTDEGWYFGVEMISDHDIVGFWGGVKNETKIV